MSESEKPRSPFLVSLWGVLLGALITIGTTAFTTHLQSRSQRAHALLERQLDIVRDNAKSCMAFRNASDEVTKAYLDAVQLIRRMDEDTSDSDYLATITETIEKVEQAEANRDSIARELRAEWALARAVFGLGVNPSDLVAPTPWPSPTPHPRDDLISINKEQRRERLAAYERELNASKIEAADYQRECRAINGMFINKIVGRR